MDQCLGLDVLTRARVLNTEARVKQPVCFLRDVFQFSVIMITKTVSTESAKK